MPEPKPEGQLAAAVKLIAVCIVCFGLIYGVVLLAAFLSG
jgi:hypothetical protein